jgi:hypothetical protein
VLSYLQRIGSPKTTPFTPDSGAIFKKWQISEMAALTLEVQTTVNRIQFGFGAGDVRMMSGNSLE